MTVHRSITIHGARSIRGWSTDHPTVPIDSNVAEIDLDMVGRGTVNDCPRSGTGAGSATYLEVVGARRISRKFGEPMEHANASQPTLCVFDYTFDDNGHPLQYYCRADHYNYARVAGRECETSDQVNARRLLTSP